MPDPVCPNCGITLKREPQRKAKCQACGQPIFVKYPPSDRKKRLMTAAQAAVVDAAWLDYHQDNRITEFCRLWGVDEAALRTGIHETGGNVDGVMETELRYILATSPDLNARAMAASTLATAEGRRGGDFVPMLREHARLTLLRLPRQVIKRVEIRAGRCVRSSQLAGRVLTIEQALQEMPIPDPQCEAKSRDGRAGYCGCHYIPVIESLRS